MFGMFGRGGCGGGFGGGCEFLWLIILISLLCGNKDECCEERRCENRCEPRRECGCNRGNDFDPCMLIFILLICGGCR